MKMANLALIMPSQTKRLPLLPKTTRNQARKYNMHYAACFCVWRQNVFLGMFFVEMNFRISKPYPNRSAYFDWWMSGSKKAYEWGSGWIVHTVSIFRLLFCHQTRFSYVSLNSKYQKMSVMIWTVFCNFPHVATLWPGKSNTDSNI